jgi:DNA polymerase-3 subunit alpha
MFTHLHCHTQFSLLDGAAKISNLLEKAKNLEMKSLAITDHGNMFGVPHFVFEAKKKGIKPIIGCEFYLCENRFDQKDSKRYHQILLAKNHIGYKNLIKLSSLSYTEGFYYKPRIDFDLINKYKDGLIATSCCMGSQICNAILNKSEDDAEKILLEWLNLFGDDFYIELQPTYIEDQKKCNDLLLKFSKKYNIKAIATNDVHYVEAQDSKAQDILICLQTGKDLNDTSRLKFSSDQFFLKSKDQMIKEFQEIPFVVENTQLIVEKIEDISINRDVLMPIFQIEDNFKTQFEYLKYLTFEGAKKKYEILTEKILERINFELEQIAKTGFEGYFLVVQDFIKAAKKLDVAVGVGRGSVVGSIVAYCIDITNVCPLKYNLIFERFLNPERISMPDIDIDFDDKGRDKVIDYVVEKYGKNQVAQIITFGSMGAKLAIKDVARVVGMPIDRANYLSKLIPEKPGTSLKESIQDISELAEIFKNQDSIDYKVLSTAETLEGSVRHSGIHAAGIIIAPQNITDFIPIKKDKDSDLFITQYDGSVVEQVGMLKMDFLGLKFLSIIKEALRLIKINRNLEIDLDKINLEDEKTFELYQNGDTIGTFQFESEGMKQWLIKLKPSNIEDLIAMNALYRPGPMQFIPNYVNRKHGIEKIEYPHPLLEEILKNTYGIMIYQEQIIKIAQSFAGYTAGSADILRKAMGKKIANEMENQKKNFIEGAKKKNNIDEKKSEEIFQIMAKFAEYGFNRSHSTAYAIIAYQSAYLKANFKEEYMCALLASNQDDIEKLKEIIKEIKKQKIKIIGPCINQSDLNFSLDKTNSIRFGLSAIKGLGSSSAEKLIEIRKKKKQFTSFFDFAESCPVNKKILESLVFSGSFDCFYHYNRNQYIHSENDQNSFIESVLKYLSKIKKKSTKTEKSIFENEIDLNCKRPIPPSVSDMSNFEKCKFEKEFIGFYISANPLDDYQIEIDTFASCNTSNLFSKKTNEVRIILNIVDIEKKISKNNRSYIKIFAEDNFGSINLIYFSSLPDFVKKNSVIMVFGKIVNSFKNAEEKEFRIEKFFEINDYRINFTKKLLVSIDIKILNDENLEKFYNLVLDHPGNSILEINLINKKENIFIKKKSQNLKVSVSEILFKSILNMGFYINLEKL